MHGKTTKCRVVEKKIESKIHTPEKLQALYYNKLIK